MNILHSLNFQIASDILFISDHLSASLISSHPSSFLINYPKGGFSDSKTQVFRKSIELFFVAFILLLRKFYRAAFIFSQHQSHPCFPSKII